MGATLSFRRDGVVGRGYSLLRDGEPIGALRRRGVWQPRYEFDSGSRHWMVRFHVGERAGEITDRDRGDVVAYLDDPSAGRTLVVSEPAWRPGRELRLTAANVEDPVTFVDADEKTWLRATPDPKSRRLEIEIVLPSGPWPSPDPEGGLLIGLALGCGKVVALADSVATT